MSRVDGPWFVPSVLILAACLRFVHVFTVHDAPWIKHLQLDHRIYDEWAKRIAAGAWAGSTAFFVDPLYAYFLAAIYWTVGYKPVVALAIQACFGIGTCYLTLLLGRRIFSERIGRWACLGMALYGPVIYYDALIEKTALSLFLFTLALVLFFGSSRRHIILSALSLALACLTRGNFLIFIPCGTLLLLLSRRHNEAGQFLLVSSLIVGAVVVRNFAVGGVIATTTNMGQNLYIGQYKENPDGGYSSPPFVRPDPRFEEADFRAEAEKRLGRALNPSEVSAYWRRQALVQINEAPGIAFERTLKKLRLFWHDFEVPDNGNMYLARSQSVILRLPLLSMGIFFPLALLGVVRSFARTKNARLAVGVVLIYCSSVVAFFILARFRIQILPIIAVFAAFGVACFVEAAKAKDRRAVLVSVGIVLAGSMISLATPTWIEAMKAPSLAIAYNNLGTLYADTGDETSAIISYEKAIELSPKSVVGAMRSLGEIYLRRGDYPKAELHMERVLQFKPDSKMARDALSRLRVTMSLETTSDGNPPLTSTAAETFTATLSSAGSGHPVWFSISADDPAAQAMHLALRASFVKAGWIVRGESVVSFPIKAGLFLFAASDQPPAYVSAVRNSFSSIGVSAAFNTGYRKYFEEMKRARPSWNGFDMAADQTYTIVIGRRPVGGW